VEDTHSETHATNNTATATTTTIPSITWHHQPIYNTKEFYRIMHDVTPDTLPLQCIDMIHMYYKPIDCLIPRTYCIKNAIKDTDADAATTQHTSTAVKPSISSSTSTSTSTTNATTRSASTSGATTSTGTTNTTAVPTPMTVYKFSRPLMDTSTDAHGTCGIRFVSSSDDSTAPRCESQPVLKCEVISSVARSSTLYLCERHALYHYMKIVYASMGRSV
jgi:hypothetical protein